MAVSSLPIVVTPWHYNDIGTKVSLDCLCAFGDTVGDKAGVLRAVLNHLDVEQGVNGVVFNVILDLVRDIMRVRRLDKLSSLTSWGASVFTWAL